MSGRNFALRRTLRRSCANVRLYSERLEERRLLCGGHFNFDNFSEVFPTEAAMLDKVANGERIAAGGDDGTASGDVANIVWVNRGLASDNFASVFGANAAAARNVVDAVIRHYERVITGFNQSSGNDRIDVTISMDSSGTGLGGGAGSYVVGSDGRMTGGAITIDRGTNGSGAGWYLDPTPDDFSEFNGQITNAFAVDAPVGSPARGLSDLYTIVLLEMTHVLGINSNGSTRFNAAATREWTDTNIADTAEGGGIGTFHVFQGNFISHLMTSNNGGAGGSDRNVPLHGAGPGVNVNFNSQTWVGAQDAMNAVYEGSRRYLVPDTSRLIMQDAFGYATVPAQFFGTGYANLNRTTRVLTLRGGDAHAGAPTSADDFYIGVQGSEIVVSIDVPVDIAGTWTTPGGGNFPAWSSRFPIADVSSIIVDAGNGDDNIYVYGVPAGVSLTVNGGNGNDFIQIGNGDLDNADGIRGNVTVNAGAGTDTLNYFDFLDDVGADTYTLTSTTISKTGVPAVTYGGSTLEILNISGNPFNNTFQIDSTVSTVAYTLSGFGGDDRFIFDVDFDLINANITVSGGAGTDTVIIDDSIDAGADAYLITGNRFEKTGTAGTVSLTSTTEHLDVTCNDDANTINVPQLSAWMNVTVRGGGGNDTFTVANNNIDSNLLGTVSVVGGAGSDTLTVSDTADTGNDAYNIAFNRIDKGGTSYIGYTQLEAATLSCNGGNNTIKLFSTTTSTPLTINGNNGDDQFIVNDGTSYLFNFGGDVTLNGGAGTDTVTVSDEAWAGSSTYTVTNGRVAVSVNSFNVYHNAAESLFVIGSDGANTINVNQTNITTFVSGEDGNDTINVGNGNFAANITATVLAIGGNGDDTAVIQDTLDAGNNTWTITSGSIVKDSSATAILATSFFGPTIDNIRIDAGAGHSTFNVTSLGSSSTPTSFAVNAGGGSDVLNVVPTTGALSNAIYGNIFMNGQAGVDAININDIADTGNDTYNIGSALTKSDTPYSIATPSSGDETITLNASNVASTINVNTTASGVHWRIYANGGDDIININGHDPASTIEISTGTATLHDTVTVNADNSGTATARLIDTVDVLDNLTIGGGGRAILPPNGNAVIKVNSVSMVGGLDLNDNALIRNAAGGAPNSSFYYSRLNIGFNNGAWNGTAGSYIHSGVAAASARNDGIGYGFGAALGITSLNGLSIAPGDFVLRYTLAGDTNLDRAVNFDDLLKLAQNYSNSVGGRQWTDGNFDFDTVEGVAGSVAFNDLLALAQNYNAPFLLQTSLKSSSSTRSELANNGKRRPDELFGDLPII